jgi:hyperosmotically inducible protein
MNRNTKLAIVASALALAAGGAHAGAAEDAALTTKVKTALLASSDTEALSVDVESKDGVVQLNGFVDTQTARAAAAKVVAGVDGVAKVDNNLAVRAADRSTSAVVDDAGITAKVKAAVIEDPLTKATDINVDTNAGVVQLNGFVASEAEKERAAQLARQVEGVAVVKNNLMVKR